MSTWPQWTVLVLMLLGVGSKLAKYGQSRTDSYDFMDVFIAPGLMLFLLYMGGFFSPIGW